MTFSVTLFFSLFSRQSREQSNCNGTICKQLFDEVFVISRIIKVEADNAYRDLDYSGYHKNRI